MRIRVCINIHLHTYLIETTKTHLVRLELRNVGFTDNFSLFLSLYSLSPALVLWLLRSLYFPDFLNQSTWMVNDLGKDPLGRCIGVGVDFFTEPFK